MAFIQVSFMSKTLMRTVPLQVILPVDKFTFGQPKREEKNWLRLQEKCFRCPEKEKTPLSEAFPWVVLAHSEMA